MGRECAPHLAEPAIEGHVSNPVSGLPVCKILTGGVVKIKAVSAALSISSKKEKKLLRLWMSETEGPKFLAVRVDSTSGQGDQPNVVACNRVELVTGCPRDGAPTHAGQTLLGA
jgi:hypothetical protein